MDLGFSVEEVVNLGVLDGLFGAEAGVGAVGEGFGGGAGGAEVIKPDGGDVVNVFVFEEGFRVEEPVEVEGEDGVDSCHDDEGVEAVVVDGFGGSDVFFQFFGFENGEKGAKV